MHITWKQMAPGLRLTGVLYRLMMPGAMPGWMLRMGNGFLRLVAKGRWIGRRSRMEQREIPREDGSLMRLCICRPKKPLEGQVPGLL